MLAKLQHDLRLADMALAPRKQVSLVEDHGKLGTFPFKATEDAAAATHLTALAVKREASIGKHESERNVKEMVRAQRQPSSRTRTFTHRHPQNISDDDWTPPPLPTAA